MQLCQVREWAPPLAEDGRGGRSLTRTGQAGSSPSPHILPRPRPVGSSRVHCALSPLLPRVEAGGPVRRTLQGVLRTGAPFPARRHTHSRPGLNPGAKCEVGRALTKGCLLSGTCPRGPHLGTRSSPTSAQSWGQPSLCRKGPCWEAGVLPAQPLHAPRSQPTPWGRPRENPRAHSVDAGRPSVPSHPPSPG